MTIRSLYRPDTPKKRRGTLAQQIQRTLDRLEVCFDYSPSTGIASELQDAKGALIQALRRASE
jgi:hypothetical protein